MLKHTEYILRFIYHSVCDHASSLRKPSIKRLLFFVSFRRTKQNLDKKNYTQYVFRRSSYFWT